MPNRTIRELVLKHFNGDKEKTNLWFSTSNPMLGDQVPNIMIALGRSEKLLKFVQNAIDQNY